MIENVEVRKKTIKIKWKEHKRKGKTRIKAKDTE